MKIFVVGANGQIGRHLIKDLATTRHQSLSFVSGPFCVVDFEPLTDTLSG